jgi:hypothetical protein
VTQPLGEIRVVDDRVFLLGLDQLYREAMTSIESLAQEGRIGSVDRVKQELEKGRDRLADALSPQAPE